MEKLENTADSGVEMNEESSSSSLEKEVKSSKCPKEENVPDEGEIHEEQIRSCEKTPEQNVKQIDHSIFNTLSKIVNPTTKNINSIMDDDDCYKLFDDFQKAIDDNNEEKIKLLIKKPNILEKKFTFSNITLLHYATKRGTINIVQQLCQQNVNVNMTNGRNETPIFNAIKNSYEMTKILLNYGASLNVTCKNNVTPFHHALLHGDVNIVCLLLENLLNKKFKSNTRENEEKEKFEEVVKIIIKYKEDLNINEKDYPLLIFFAAKSECLCVLELLLGEKKKKLENLLNTRGYFDRTCLHYAVRGQETNVVKFLLKQGANPNCKTRDNFTPLHYAVALENEEICRILIENGANVNVESSREGTPLYVITGRSEMKNLLNSTDGYYYDETHNTFINRMNSYYEPDVLLNLKIMKLLLENGANTECRGANGTTPFLEACRSGQFDKMKILLEYNANYHALDYEKNSALHHAAIGCSFEIIDFLLWEKNFPIDTRNENDYTPLMSAVQNERRTCLEIIEYLVDCGANVNCQNKRGATCLHIAAYFESQQIVECLIELGANWQMNFETENYNCPAMGEILTSFYFPGVQSSRKLIISMAVLKNYEEKLPNFIVSYVGKEGEILQEARDYLEESKIEIGKLRETMIMNETNVTYYDFLTRDFYSSYQLIKNLKLRKILSDGDYKKEFPCFNYLLERRFKRVEILENSIDKIVDFITNCGKIQLPILAVDVILRQLRSIDFRIFGRVLAKKRF